MVKEAIKERGWLAPKIRRVTKERSCEKWKWAIKRRASGGQDGCDYVTVAALVSTRNGRRLLDVQMQHVLDDRGFASPGDPSPRKGLIRSGEVDGEGRGREARRRSGPNHGEHARKAVCMSGILSTHATAHTHNEGDDLTGWKGVSPMPKLLRFMRPPPMEVMGEDGARPRVKSRIDPINARWQVADRDGPDPCRC
jgi:hypothetical protein